MVRLQLYPGHVPISVLGQCVARGGPTARGGVQLLAGVRGPVTVLPSTGQETSLGSTIVSTSQH